MTRPSVCVRRRGSPHHRRQRRHSPRNRHDSYSPPRHRRSDHSPKLGSSVGAVIKESRGDYDPEKLLKRANEVMRKDDRRQKSPEMYPDRRQRSPEMYPDRRHRRDEGRQRQTTRSCHCCGLLFFFGSIDGVLRGFLVHVPEGYEMHIPPTGCNFELCKGNFSFSTFLVEKII